MANMKKKLGSKIIDRAMDKYDEKHFVDLEIDVNGENETVTVGINKYFSDTRIRKMTTDYVDALIEIRKKNARLMLESQEPLFFVHLFKHFTDIEVPESLEEKIDMFTGMIDLGLFQEITQHFDSDELEKLMKAIDKIIYEIDSNMDKIEDLIENSEEEYKMLREKEGLDKE